VNCRRIKRVVTNVNERGRRGTRLNVENGNWTGREGEMVLNKERGMKKPK
jgi:hypothetical protein